MINMVQSTETIQSEHEKAKAAKQAHQDELEKEHERLVVQEEAEEAAEKKKQEDAAEKAALDAAANSPQARAMSAAREAASSINMGDLEANIEANLQTQLASGRSKADLMQSLGTAEDVSTFSLPQASLPAPISSFTSMYQAPAPVAAPKPSVNTQSIIQQAIARSKAKAHPAPRAAPVRAPVQSLAVAAPIAAPVAAYVAPVAVMVPAAAVTTQIDAEVLASQDKIREMASKLNIPFTNDLLALGSNSAISDALIEKAVALGRSEAQINAAMAAL